MSGVAGTYRCPNCGASHEVRERDVAIRCGYCGVTFRTFEEEKRYVLPVHYDSSKALENFLLWAEKQHLYDESLPREMVLREVSLHFYPFWVATVRASTAFTGLGEDAEYSNPDGKGFRTIKLIRREESGSFERLIEFAVPASGEVPVEGEMVAVSRARLYFSHEYVRRHGGVLHGATVSREEARRAAERAAAAELTRLISREVVEVRSRSDEISVGELSLVYVPVWDVTYEFRGKKYRAMIDASSSRVILATYPSEVAERAAYLGISALHLVAGITLAAVIWGSSWLTAVTALAGMATASAYYARAALAPAKAHEPVTEGRRKPGLIERIYRRDMT
ncbi:MAG: zinc-ribbon domain-containing protein [Aigarchaeota archaeon]|nr:zinc-ribbon domain-containing protein [Aigarchaeota archaeon]